LLASVFFAGKSIDARKQRELALARAGQEALRSSQAKSDFLATMSHEIRTPMTTVLGVIRLLQRTPLDETQSRYANAIKGASHLLLAILNDVLDLAKIEAGKLEIEKTPFDPTEAITQVVECFEFQAQEKGVLLRTQLRSPLPSKLLGDPLRLRQVLMNLVGNALKFTQSGFIEVEADCHPGGTLAIAVRDTGIGISEEAAKTLFAKFSQAEKNTSRKYGGTGLGLSICKQLVELMGGKIGVESRPGEGARFSFTLRTEPVADSVAVTSPFSEIERPRASAPSACKILLAEDDSVNRMVILKTLQFLGFSADGVANGNEVLGQLARSRYDLVLMDCRMPELDGYETTRRIRKGVAGIDPRIPIIALTANALKLERDNCRVAGMDDHVSKPIDEETLERKLRQWFKEPAQGPTAIDESRIATLLKLGTDLKDAGFAKAVIESYLRESRQRVSKLDQAIRRGDWNVIGGEAHALRSSSANVGASGLCEICEKLEDWGRLPAIQAAPYLAQAGREFEKLVRLYDDATRQLRVALDRSLDASFGKAA
jgi:CheY-like chemotaxis protein